MDDILNRRMKEWVTSGKKVDIGDVGHIYKDP